jgi:hypothetical protein
MILIYQKVYILSKKSLCFFQAFEPKSLLPGAKCPEVFRLKLNGIMLQEMDKL